MLGGENQQVDAELWPQAVSSAIPDIIKMMDDVMVDSQKIAGRPNTAKALFFLSFLSTLYGLWKNCLRKQDTWSPKILYKYVYLDSNLIVPA